MTIKITRAICAALLAMVMWQAQASETVHTPVPGAVDAFGRKVLTFIAKDPPGARCNGNLQVAVAVANTYRVPIQLLPSSFAPGLPAPAVYYGDDQIVADGLTYNGAATFQMVADVLDVEGVQKHDRQGLIFDAGVRPDFEGLKRTIKQGGK